MIAYLGRHTGWGLDELDRQKLSRLRRLADAVEDIIRAENKT